MEQVLLNGLQEKLLTPDQAILAAASHYGEFDLSKIEAFGSIENWRECAAAATRAKNLAGVEYFLSRSDDSYNSKEIFKIFGLALATGDLFFVSQVGERLTVNWINIDLYEAARAKRDNIVALLLSKKRGTYFRAILGAQAGQNFDLLEKLLDFYNPLEEEHYLFLEGWSRIPYSEQIQPFLVRISSLEDIAFILHAASQQNNLALFMAVDDPSLPLPDANYILSDSYLEQHGVSRNIENFLKFGNLEAIQYILESSSYRTTLTASHLWKILQKSARSKYDEIFSYLINLLIWTDAQKITADAISFAHKDELDQFSQSLQSNGIIISDLYDNLLRMDRPECLKQFLTKHPQQITSHDLLITARRGLVKNLAILLQDQQFNLLPLMKTAVEHSRLEVVIYLSEKIPFWKNESFYHNLIFLATDNNAQDILEHLFSLGNIRITTQDIYVMRESLEKYPMSLFDLIFSHLPSPLNIPELIKMFDSYYPRIISHLLASSALQSTLNYLAMSGIDDPYQEKFVFEYPTKKIITDETKTYTIQELFKDPILDTLLAKVSISLSTSYTLRKK